MENPNKRSHPLHTRWQMLRRRPGALHADWVDDFWQFAREVGLPPEGAKKLRRVRQAEPMGPNNFEWARTPTEEEKLAYYREWNRANPEKVREAKYQRYYGISHAEYERLFAEQEGLCAICHKAESRFIRKASRQPRNLCVDHDHETGKVRGLLCGDCNVALGAFRDNPTTILKAIGYLRQHERLARERKKSRFRVVE